MSGNTAPTRARLVRGNGWSFVYDDSLLFSHPVDRNWRFGVHPPVFSFYQNLRPDSDKRDWMKERARICIYCECCFRLIEKSRHGGHSLAEFRVEHFCQCARYVDWSLLVGFRVHIMQSGQVWNRWLLLIGRDGCDVLVSCQVQKRYDHKYE